MVYKKTIYKPKPEPEPPERFDPPPKPKEPPIKRKFQIGDRVSTMKIFGSSILGVVIDFPRSGKIRVELKDGRIIDALPTHIHKV